MPYSYQHQLGMSVDHRPDDHPAAIGERQGLAVDDGRIGNAVVDIHDWLRSRLLAGGYLNAWRGGGQFPNTGAQFSPINGHLHNISAESNSTARGVVKYAP